MMKGVISTSTGSWYTVRTEEGTSYSCRIRGQLRLKGYKTTNPVAVGDIVSFELQDDGITGVIQNIFERRNAIVRKSINLSKQMHLIATNMDRAYLVVSLFEPCTPFGFMDRFLVNAEAYHVPVTLVFNKIDSYDAMAQALLSQAVAMYSAIGYDCRCVSALRGDGVEALRQEMQGQTSLFAGNSGVGKSALINALDTQLQIKTGEVSQVHKKGKHTTTFAEMHPLSIGGYIIDTPGIKEFGMVDFRKEEVALYFPEMRALVSACRFSNCTHLHEPGCAVKEALEKGAIAAQRYTSYCNIYGGKEMDVEAWEIR